jgi:glycosyltransferase involved in cell wall biosynthesis
VKNNVSIKRNLSDELLQKEFCSADIFVLPSLKTSQGIEGFGIVLLEAMAYHLPIVASGSGGIPEVLDNGSCGILVKPGDIDELVSSIKYVSNNPSRAESLAKNAYERLVNYYVWKQ